LTSGTDHHRAEVDALIKENRQIAISEIALTVGISYGSAFAIVHSHLSYHKICARRIPQQQMEEHKQSHLTNLRVSYRDEAKKERICCNELSGVTKHGSIIINQTLNDRV
jgi:hypothetical protein